MESVSLWYDGATLIMLGLFAWSGSAKGAVWQLAIVVSVAGCALLAGPCVPLIEAQLPVPEPVRHWASIGVLYAVVSLLSFLLARQLKVKLEQKKLDEYDRHWGAILGVVKGVGLSLALSCLAVVMAPPARPVIRESIAGTVAARVIQWGHDALPERVAKALLNGFQSDAPEPAVDRVQSLLDELQEVREQPADHP